MNLRRIFNPWGCIRDLESEVGNLNAQVSSAKNNSDYWRGQAALMADRYDKIRETAAGLRETLTLYRNNS